MTAAAGHVAPGRFDFAADSTWIGQWAAFDAGEPVAMDLGYRGVLAVPASRTTAPDIRVLD